MSKKNRLTVAEQLARFHAVQDRVIEERLWFAPRGVPKWLLRAFVKGTSIATKYPTMEDWLFIADDGGTGGKAELSPEALIAVLLWRLETERFLDIALKGEDS